MNASGEQVEPVVSVEGGHGAYRSQGDAEAWFGQRWPELLAAGVDQVCLLKDGAVIYGPMSLHEE